MKLFATIFAAILFSTVCFSQIPTNISLQIIKAEDERRFDKALETLTVSANSAIRKRSALALGRIGDERAIPALIDLLEKDSAEIRAMAAFAIGEIESIKGADAILKVLANTRNDGEVRAYSIEAAGKIAAANAKDEKSKLLGEAILNAVKFENSRRSMPNTTAILFGLTAILRSKPENASNLVAVFLDYSSATIRQTALNTLGRLRTKDKNINEIVLKMLTTDEDAIVRANACRVLGISEDISMIPALLKATNDNDSRVRVSAIRALGSFKDNKIADSLIERGEMLLKNFKLNKMELLEIATSLGRLLANVDDESAVRFLQKIRVADNYQSPETEVAFAKIVPKLYLQMYKLDDKFATWQKVGSQAQGLGELANLKDETLKTQAKNELTAYFSEFLATTKPAEKDEMNKAVPDCLQAIAAFKTEKSDELFRESLATRDVQIRATAASLLGELPPSDATKKSLEEAFAYSLKFDTKSNDAQLAILDAIGKQKDIKDNKALQSALNSEDILVRRKAVQVLKTIGVDASDKIGTVTNSVFKQADYLRAISRKNGTVKAVFTTEKGIFTIDLMPEDAPLTVENFIRLANSNYFNGISVHRVVPNFVMQDGDPRGDGNGGPGYSIRCEINMLRYERGAVGMALSGKDTGGSQWFVTHSPQPHLDGGYTVFGKATETDMKIVDTISRGDKILTVKIVEATAKVKKQK